VDGPGANAEALGTEEPAGCVCSVRHVYRQLQHPPGVHPLDLPANVLDTIVAASSAKCRLVNERLTRFFSLIDYFILVSFQYFIDIVYPCYSCDTVLLLLTSCCLDATDLRQWCKFSAFHCRSLEC
jgi:hypothetical protein